MEPLICNTGCLPLFHIVPLLPVVEQPTLPQNEKRLTVSTGKKVRRGVSVVVLKMEHRELGLL